jgi:hypothetical protein
MGYIRIRHNGRNGGLNLRKTVIARSEATKQSINKAELGF